MFWVIVGIIIVIAVCSMASSLESAANAEKAKANEGLSAAADAKKARVVSSFQELLKEEFPEFAALMTFAAMDQAYKAYASAFTDPRNRGRFTLFDASKFKTPQDRRTVVEDALSRGSAAISAEFRAAVMGSVDARIRFERAYLASQTRAG